MLNGKQLGKNLDKRTDCTTLQDLKPGIPHLFLLIWLFACQLLYSCLQVCPFQFFVTLTSCLAYVSSYYYSLVYNLVVSFSFVITIPQFEQQLNINEILQFSNINCIGSTTALTIVTVPGGGFENSAPSQKLFINCPLPPGPVVISKRPCCLTGCAVISWDLPSKNKHAAEITSFRLVLHCLILFKKCA